MKPNLMPLRPFDQRRIGSGEVLYIFPLPNGPRVLVTTNGTDLTMVTDYGEDLTNFSPDVEEAVKAVYRQMLSEPNRAYTLNGKQVNFPNVMFDCILHDRVYEESQLGQATNVAEALDGDWDLLGAPIENGLASITVLAAMMEDEYKAKQTKHDIWWDRAHVKRGCIATGNGLIERFPRPIITWLNIAPRDGRDLRTGVAQDDPAAIWKCLYGVFERPYRGALIVDVWSGWKVSGNGFQLITEEDVEL